jgi:hypothetical protein
MKLTQRQIISFACYTDAQLDAYWRAIEYPLPLRDEILAEITRRRALHHIDVWERCVVDEGTPAHLQEDTQAEFDRYIAGDR